MTQVADRPVFIVGCPRSGTTLVQRMLDAHPDVAIAPETFFIRRFWRWRAEYGDLDHDAHFDRLLDDITATPEFTEMGLDDEAYVAAAAEGARSYAVLFRLLLRQFARQRSASVVGEKTPNHVLYLPTLRDFFPEARFVHIVRDPRAVAHSWRTVPWSSRRLWRDAEIWVEYVSAGRAAASQLGERLHVVHFESLVHAPEATLRTLCAFMEIRFDPAMLVFHERTPRAVNVEREPWKENVTQPINPDAAGQWQDELTPGQVAEIEAVAVSEMRRWDYTPRSSTWRRAAVRATLPPRRLGWKVELLMKDWQKA